MYTATTINNELHCAIVIQSYIPKKQKLMLLDQKLGLIEAYFIQKNQGACVTHGMIITYSLYKESWGYQIRNSTLIATIDEWVKGDLLFFHQILESVRYSMPYNQQDPEIFNFLMLMYRPIIYTQAHELKRFKKIFLCHFFVLAGIIPDQCDLFSLDFFSLISAPIDIMVKAENELLDYNQLTVWLEQSIASHPYTNRFKTVLL